MKPAVVPVTMAEVEAAAAAVETVVVNETAAAIASLLPTPPRRSDDAEPERYRPSLGTVALAAAGPGDPELVSVRTATLLGAADVILADASTLPVAERFAGRRSLIRSLVDADGLPLEPAARVKLAVESARASRDVVRLLGTDPTTDSSWAAEAALLTKAKVPFEFSPGVSLISGVTSHAGIPLTGGRAREVRILDADDTTIVWADHGDSRVNLVILNGADRAVEIARALVDAGRRDDTPVAITRDGTTVEQRTVTATLADLAVVVKASRQSGPGVMVVGETVGKRSTLSWFETKPLFGWRVLVPRTKESQTGLADHLRRYGAVAVEVPTISVEPPRTPQQMERAVHGLVSGRYQWIIFTSVNAVRALREKFEEYGLDSRAYSGLRIAAVGLDTADALEQFGVRADLIPSGDQSTASLVDEFPEFDDIVDPINRVFLPRADIATEGLVAGLSELGWEVDDVTAYRTVRAAPPPAETREAIKSGGFDAVLFTSSSTVRNLVGIAGKPHQTTVVACIGPQTSKTAEEHGLRVDVRSETSNVFALVDALAEHGEKLRLAAADSGEYTWRPSRRRGAARRRTT
ncbi:MAG: uroporphyrinogen-III synthase [Actinobacteria bacterium]|nr:uroporphyrinogen-III synthase [Actinomycetota bacterium]